MSFEEERDTKQRSFGCISFSLMAHGGLLALLALAPNVTNDPFGLPDGNADTPAAFVDLMSPGSAPASDSISKADEPKEVLLAKTDDPSAVVLPQKSLPQPEQKSESPKPIPSAKAEKNAKPAKAEKKAGRKVEPKKSVAKKTAPEKGDIAVRAALAQAREEEPTRVVEKVDAEAAVEEKSEPVQEDIANLGSDSTEETSSEENSPVSKPEAVAAEDFTKTEPYPEATPEPPQEAAPQEDIAETLTPPVPTEDLEQVSQEEEKKAPLPVAAAPTSEAIAGANAVVKQIPSGQGSGTGTAARTGRGLGYGIPLGMQIGNADLLREAPGNRPPSYPIEEKLRHKEGTPVIVAQVRPNGSIGQIVLERSSGSALIDQAALKAYKNYRYMPGQQGWVRKAFEFRLTGDAKINPARLHRQ